MEIQCSFIELNILQKVSERFPLGPEGQEFAKFLRSQEQFIRIVKGQNNFW